MSMTIEVFLNKSDLPDISVWQQAVDRLGYDLTLTPGWDLIDDSGVWPSSLNGQPAAFEYIFDHAALGVAEGGQIPDAAKEYDSLVCFVFGGSFTDGAAAMIASASLASLVPSVLYDPEADEACSGSEAIAYVQPTLTELKVFPRKV